MKNAFKKIVSKILTHEARGALKRRAPTVVAVTGSVGKTSTKDAIAAALAEATDVSIRKSQKSFNSDIGVPLAILGLQNAWNSPLGWLKNIITGFFAAHSKNFPKILVLEIGADHPGDISSIAAWLPVDVIVFTRMADVPVHIEFFGSPEKVLEEKVSLIKALKKNGTIVVNGNDDKFLNATKNSGKKFVEYGKEGFAPRELSALAALSVVSVLGFDVEKAKHTLENYDGPAGRMKTLEGINGSTIIDDTYNSSPIALESALKTLKNTKALGRKIAVLGDMRELGEYSVKAHYDAGKLVAKSADILFAVGHSAKYFSRGASDGGLHPSKIYEFLTSIEAGKKLVDFLRLGDLALVKGSQGMRMEKAVAMVIKEKSRAKELLVRQEKEWKKR